ATTSWPPSPGRGRARSVPTRRWTAAWVNTGLPPDGETGSVGDLQHNRNISARTTFGGEPNYPWSPSLRREGPGPPVRGLFPCPGQFGAGRRGRIRAVHEVTITIRWRDVDNYGHVNNAVYLTYLEECRDRLVESLFGTDEAWDFVLARVAIDYRNQLTQA